jgi:hypothetical protein
MTQCPEFWQTWICGLKISGRNKQGSWDQIDYPPLSFPKARGKIKSFSLFRVFKSRDPFPSVLYAIYVH